MTAEMVTAVGTIVLAVGTLVLAAVAIFQDTIRSWVYPPTLDVSIQTRPPDCSAVPITSLNGTFLADTIYLRMWVKNIGRGTARNVEVYAKELLRKRIDNTWERVGEFTPMNLQWSNIHVMFFPNIVPETGKHCDLGHIADPVRRNAVHEGNPRLNLTDQETSLAFDVIAPPNHKGHIVGPGDYQLKVLVAAENSRHPLNKTVSISLKGRWHADESTMLRDGVGVTVG
jgi:hypothetical protein